MSMSVENREVITMEKAVAGFLLSCKVEGKSIYGLRNKVRNLVAF